MSASERDLLRRVASMSVALFVVLNKADYLDDGSLTQAQEFTASVLAEAVGGPHRVHPMSARAALGPAGDPGFSAFAADFAAYLDTGRVTAVQEAVTRHVYRIGQQLVDEVALAARAARLPGAEADAQIASFGDRLRSVSDRRSGAEDRALGQSRRLLEALNAAAEQAVPRLAKQVGADLTVLVNADLRTAPAAGSSTPRTSTSIRLSCSRARCGGACRSSTVGGWPASGCSGR